MMEEIREEDMRELWVLMPEDEYYFNQGKVLVYRWIFVGEYTLGSDPLWFSSAEEAELKAAIEGVTFKKLTKAGYVDGFFDF